MLNRRFSILSQLSGRQLVGVIFYCTVPEVLAENFLAVATHYPHVSYVLNGEEIKGSGRQTFVFSRKHDGWKLVHEHVTPKQNYFGLSDRYPCPSSH